MSAKPPFTTSDLPATSEKMLTHEQAARALNISVASVRELFASGDLTSCLESPDLIDTASVEAFGTVEHERRQELLRLMTEYAEDIGLCDTHPTAFSG